MNSLAAALRTNQVRDLLVGMGRSRRPLTPQRAARQGLVPSDLIRLGLLSPRRDMKPGATEPISYVLSDLGTTLAGALLAEREMWHTEIDFRDGFRG